MLRNEDKWYDIPVGETYKFEATLYDYDYHDLLVVSTKNM